MENFKSFKGLMKNMKSHGALFTGAPLSLTFAVACESGGKLLIRFIIDEAVSENLQMNLLLQLALGYLGFAVAQGAFSFFEGRGRSKAAENIAKEIREKLFDHIQRLSFSYHDKSSVGEMVQKATSDVDSVRKFYGEQIPGFLRIVLLYLINCIALLTIDYRLALVGSIIVPIVILISRFFFKRIYKSYDEHQEQEGNVSTLVQENLHGIRVVRAFAKQNWESKKFEEENTKQMKKGLKVVFWHTLYWPIAHALCGLQFAGAFAYTGYLTITDDAITLGTLIASSFLFSSLIWPMQELGRMITEISHSFVSHNRIQSIMEVRREDSLDTPKAEPVKGIQGELEFRNVGFSYVETSPVLRDITFSCKPGEKIALLGETGSGKSTLVNLLPRFYDYDMGSITLDSVELKNYSRSDLRKVIGIVEQDPFLFTMTIRENIAYSVNREVSDDEITEAAKAAAVHESIMSFPQQYDTLVGEKGVSLSGGQKQRLAIARTLLKDPEILILDDSTSAIDAQTEQSIQKALDRLMKNRTTFIIAHRIQTLQKADKIIVLKEGQIIQMGTHNELKTQPGFYKSVFDLQTTIETELANELAS